MRQGTFPRAGVIALGLLFALSAVPAQAANPATINVTVTIQNISVSAAGPIAFGTVASGSTTVGADSSEVTNDGNVTETFSLDVTNPAGWTAVQAVPGVDEYVLSAQFNSTAPTAVSFNYTDHALTTVSTAASASQFAGDQTGLSVPASGVRYLWLKFEAPSSTTVFTQQTIVVTITASAG